MSSMQWKWDETIPPNHSVGALCLHTTKNGKLKTWKSGGREDGKTRPLIFKQERFAVLRMVPHMRMQQTIEVVSARSENVFRK